MQQDRAGRPYWETVWRDGAAPSTSDAGAGGGGNAVDRRFREYFRAVLTDAVRPGALLLEVGCGSSRWLPYFAKDFGFDVFGIDYSLSGCFNAKEMLAKAGQRGTVVCGDFFSPPSSLHGKFDVVVSFGVAEHFTDTAGCIAAFTEFLRPSGLLLTSVPKLAGLVGRLQRWLSPAIFGIHTVLRREDLSAAHRKSGLEVLRCEYFLAANFGVCNMSKMTGGAFGREFKRRVVRLLARASVLAWEIEKRVGRFRPSRLFSPYVNCVARKTAGEGNLAGPTVGGEVESGPAGPLIG